MKLLPILSLLSPIFADVPVSCPYSSTLGTWEFSIGTSGNDQSLVEKCGLSNLGPVSKTVKFLLQEKNKVTNLETGSTGTYTIVSTQGFEISIDGRHWWAYYYFDSNNHNNNDCSKTSVGYQRDDLMKSWSCIQGQKINSNGEKTNQEIDNFKISEKYFKSIPAKVWNKKFTKNENFINKVNKNAKTWTAKHNIEWEKYTLSDMQARQGFEINLSKSTKSTEDKLQAARDFVFPSDVPRNWNWANVNGENFDSPVWDQQSCGSCYAFAAKSFLEARMRVSSNNINQPTYSAQEIITCGSNQNYNQGCSGGFGYLIAGKYGMEAGVVDESCNPDTLSYNYINTTCPDTSSCKRFYTSSYEYLGGFYGAATPEMMLKDLYNNGPIGIGIYAPSDFHSYSSGIYYQDEDSNLKDDWNPIVPTNHAVVIVGYGKCPDVISDNSDPNCPIGNESLPYWIVKNSWGTSFGNGGYVNVLLGVDEIACESKPITGMVSGLL